MCGERQHIVDLLPAARGLDGLVLRSPVHEQPSHDNLHCLVVSSDREDEASCLLAHEGCLGLIEGLNKVLAQLVVRRELAGVLEDGENADGVKAAVRIGRRRKALHSDTGERTGVNVRMGDHPLRDGCVGDQLHHRVASGPSDANVVTGHSTLDVGDEAGDVGQLVAGAPTDELATEEDGIAVSHTVGRVGTHQEREERLGEFPAVEVASVVNVVDGVTEESGDGSLADPRESVNKLLKLSSIGGVLVCHRRCGAHSCTVASVG